MASTAPDGPDWAAIYTEHGQAMRRAARSILGDQQTLGKTADDVVIDLLEELMVKELPPRIRNLRGYLSAAARRRAIDLIRSRGADDRVVSKSAAHEAVEDWEDVIDTEILAAAAVDSLDMLPDRERYAIEQRVMLRRQAKHVAAELDVTPQRVSQLVGAGLARLRKLPPFARLGLDDPPAIGVDAPAPSPDVTGSER